MSNRSVLIFYQNNNMSEINEIRTYFSNLIEYIINE